MELKMDQSARYPTQRPVQLAFPFSWAESRSNGSEQSKADRGGNRYRPENDDSPFAQARGHIPPVGIARYRRRGANNAEQVE
jgi:hypothetical protein